MKEKWIDASIRDNAIFGALSPVAYFTLPSQSPELRFYFAYMRLISKVVATSSSASLAGCPGLLVWPVDSAGSSTMYIRPI